MATYRRMLKDKDGNNIIPAGFLDAIYPVGSIYMSATLSTASQVQNALGGVWEKWGAGRVPVGVDTTQTEFNTVSKTGGEKTHTLTVSEMPRHNHNLDASVATFNDQKTRLTNNRGTTTTAYYMSSTSDGNDQPHNNLQPYITCYMYKRTA